MMRSFVAPAGTTLFVSSSDASTMLPLEERVKASVLSPAVVLKDIDRFAESVVECSASEWSPVAAGMVSMEPAAMVVTSVPSIVTDTGVVKAFTIRKDGLCPSEQQLVMSVLQAARQTRSAMERRRMAKVLGCSVLGARDAG